MNNHTKKWFALAIMPAIFFCSTLLADDEKQTSIARNDYIAKGIKVGGFTIKPTLESENVYNSNIYSSQRNLRDDFIFHVKPSVILESNWSRHSLMFTGTADTLSYATHSREDQQNYTLNLDGRLDVMRNSFFHANALYSHQTENRGSPDSNPISLNAFNPLKAGFNALNPVEYEVVGGTLGYEHKINRVRINADNEIKRLNFTDGHTGNGTFINNQDRNRLKNEASLRIGYEITPNYEAFVKGSYNFINYDSKFDDYGLQRSSEGYKTVAGIALDFTGKLTGDAYVGYQSQNYDDVRLKTISGISGGMGLTWLPTRLTTVKANIDRTVNETTQSTASGYFGTLFSAGVTHELLRNLILTADAGYGMNNYRGGNQRVEDIYNVGVGAKYLINRYFYLKGGYEYNNRSSNISGTNYDINRAYLTIGSHL